MIVVSRGTAITINRVPADFHGGHGVRGRGVRQEATGVDLQSRHAHVVGRRRADRPERGLG